MFAALVVLLGLVASLPWIAYAVALAQIDGRPTPPAIQRLSPEQIESLHLSLRKAGPLTVPELSPWEYVFDLVWNPERLSSGGVAAAWVVAKDFNLKHLKGRRSTWWHFSGAALVVWLTRNWSSDQVLARAFEIEHERGAESNHLDFP